jgi:hypothetical protein
VNSSYPAARDACHFLTTKTSNYKPSPIPKEDVMKKGKGRFTIYRVLALAALCLSAALAAADGPYGGCPAPSKPGVKVCYPVAGNIGDSPVQVIASGTGAHGPVRLMEVWADGNKIQEVGGYLFDLPVKLSTGDHVLTVVELDTTGDYIPSAPVKIQIWGSSESDSCPARGLGPGVDVCSPTPFACQEQGGQMYEVLATGRGASGQVLRMELWVEDTKLANFPGSEINTSLELPAYKWITIIEVDTKGAYIKSVPFKVIGGC